MAERLGELWGVWSGGPGTLFLVVAIVVLTAAWIGSAVATWLVVSRRWGPTAGFVAMVVFVPLTAATVGIVDPDAWIWWALAGLALAPVLATLVAMVFGSRANRCPEGHPVGPNWAFCPACPSPLAVPTAARAPRNEVVLVRPRDTVLRTPEAAPVVEDDRPSPFVPEGGTVLLWLIPESPGIPDIAVRKIGAVIGRNPAAEICIDDATVSWEHARIVSRDSAPALVDLDSSNGTYVNDERVEQVLLLNDDRVQFGSSTFRVVRP
ncbi:MAG: FHA domain-containing protein [Acidimicrobiales bacterium]